MHSKTVLTLAVVGAALLPMSGARADHHEETKSTTTTTTTTSSGAASMTNTVMDAGLFRDRLHEVRDLFNKIRSNNRLSLAASDPLIFSQYEQTNRRLLNDTLGVLAEVTQNWRSAAVPGVASANTERWGAADTARFANESDDTAFVRNTVWSLEASLLADKLNGRNPMVTDQMVSMLDAAIRRAENPNFRVASAWSSERLRNMKIEFSEGYQPTNTITETESTRTETVASTPGEFEYKQVNLEHDNLPDRNQIAQRTDEEPIRAGAAGPEEDTSRMGAADTLPQTGGDPGTLILLGTTLAGMGTFLRRRRS